MALRFSEQKRTQPSDRDRIPFSNLLSLHLDLAVLFDRTTDRLEAKIIGEEWYINDVFERLELVILA